MSFIIKIEAVIDNYLLYKIQGRAELKVWEGRGTPLASAARRNLFCAPSRRFCSPPPPEKPIF